MVPPILWMMAVCAGISGAEPSALGRSRLLPDHVKFQFAGNMGLLSVGAGYSFLGGRLQSDIFYGYVPASYAGTSIHHITWKNTVIPWNRKISSRLSYAPLTLGAHLSGKVWNNNRETWMTLPGRYPNRYYYPTALNLLLTAGGCVEYRSRAGRHLGMYVEAGAPVRYLEHSVRERHVEFHEIVSYDLGWVRMF